MPSHLRAAATGEHAEYLREASHRLESVASLLAAAALEHVSPGDLQDSLGSIVGVLDDAQRFVQRAGTDTTTP